MAAGYVSVTLSVRLISTLFVTVYVAACGASIRLLEGSARFVGMTSFCLVLVVLLFAQLLVIVPAAIMGAAVLYVNTTARLRGSRARAPDGPTNLY